MRKKIAVIGLGLLGGSLSKSIKKEIPEVMIRAYGINPNKLRKALDDRSVDSIGLIDELDVKEFGLIIVSTPVAVSVEIIRNILQDPGLAGDTLIIDVGSVKNPIIEEVKSLKNAGQFIGCHPMAGSEDAGYNYSTGTMFHSASVIITPHERNSEEDIKEIAGFWQTLKSTVFIVPPYIHDIAVAYTSHMPHMAACSVIKTLMNFLSKSSKIKDINHFIGNGLLDVTRISSGLPEIWKDIALLNKDNIVSALTMFIRELSNLKDRINNVHSETEPLYDYLDEVKQFRDRLGDPQNSSCS